MNLKNGEFTPNAFYGMGGYWCVFCQMSHTSHGCSHPGRAFARQHELELAKAYEIIDQLLKACKRVEWVCDPECRTEDTKYCPWCLGVEPGQWQVNFKAQELEVNIGHAKDCPRQAAIAAAEGE
jgi:hypothetical protein